MQPNKPNMNLPNNCKIVKTQSHSKMITAQFQMNESSSSRNAPITKASTAKTRKNEAEALSQALPIQKT